jgi:hypothetical protein
MLVIRVYGIEIVKAQGVNLAGIKTVHFFSVQFETSAQLSFSIQG